jgi:hypothetical protein
MRFHPSTPAGSGGFALPLMLAVLALGSLLVTASFLMARLEVQSGENGLNTVRALEAAETGLGEITAWWDPSRYNLLAPGDSLALPARMLGGGGYTGKLVRLSPALFQIEAAGWSRARANLPVARRTLRSIVRIADEGPAISAALTVIDSLVWDGGSQVSGNDTIPPGWGGLCSSDSSVAALVAPPAAQLSLGLCPSCFAGLPPIATDSALGSSTLSTFGTGGYAGLATHARFSLTGTPGNVAPRVSGLPPSCVVSDSLNWGEPMRSGPFAACGGYQPVIHSPGNLTLTSGRGQGMLLVDGDLELGGGFVFVGIVVVRGTLRNGPGGGSILGALLTRSIALDSALPGSTLSIRYSACVLPTATRGSSLAIPLRYRNWAQSF